MGLRRWRLVRSWLAAAALAAPVAAQVGVVSTATAPFPNFESGPVRPLLLTPDGALLLALNTPDHRLEVFLPDPQGLQQPTYLTSVFTGLEPVSMTLHPTVPDRVFVANALSDTVSVVDLSRLQVVATIDAGDEPADVAVSAGRLFVCTARAPVTPALIVPGPMVENAIVVAEASPPFARLGVVAVPAHRPRSLAVTGDTVWIVPQNSANDTVSIDEPLARLLGITQLDLDFFEPPFTVNPVLLRPEFSFPPFIQPQFGLPGWAVPSTGRIFSDFDLPGLVPAIADRDLFALDAVTGALAPGATTDIGTTLLGLAARPGTDELWITGTEAGNRLRFESRLNGTSMENRVVTVGTDGVVRAVRRLTPPLTTRQHAQPGAIAFASRPAGDRVLVASLGGASVVALDADTGALVAEVDTAAVPTGLAVDDALGVMYVLSRAGKTITAYDIDAGFSKLGRSEPFGYDPEPPGLSRGRRHLYDARAVSGHGNGNASCASCHVFGHVDQLAWDLGDPEGGLGWFYTDLMTGESGSAGLPVATAGTVMTHPMKGPMVTQSLRGIGAPEGPPLHWRGDRRFIQMFGGAFRSLLDGGGVSARDMQEFATFVSSLTFPPNPHQPRDRVYRDAQEHGREMFGLDPEVPGKKYDPIDAPDLLCVTCHEADFEGKAGFSGARFGVMFDAQTQFLTVAGLRGLYEKEHRGLTGFGLLHDGSVDDLDVFMDLTLGVSGKDAFPGLSPSERDDMAAFLRAWDTGLSPLVGAQLTVTAADLPALVPWIDLATTQAEPPASNVDLIAKATILNGVQAFRPVGVHYTFDPGAGAYGWRADLDAFVTFDTLALAVGLGLVEVTFTCVPPGLGHRLGVDRDEDGVLDGVEAELGTDPTDPDSDDDGHADGAEVAAGSDPVSAASVPADAAAPVVTLAEARAVFTTTATLRVVTDEPASLSVAVLPSGGSHEPPQAFLAASLRRTHDVFLDGLPPDTLLTARIQATDKAGNASTTEIELLTEPPMLHLADVDVRLVSSPPWVIEAVVTVVDQDGAPVEDVPVRGAWAGPLPPMDWMPEQRTDAAGKAVFPVPPFVPSSPVTISFSPLHLGSNDPGDPYFVGLGGERPAFFYEAAANLRNWDSVTVAP